MFWNVKRYDVNDHNFKVANNSWRLNMRNWGYCIQLSNVMIHTREWIAWLDPFALFALRFFAARSDLDHAENFKSLSAATKPRDSVSLIAGSESSVPFLVFFPKDELKRASISSSCLLRFFFSWDEAGSATEDRWGANSPEDSFDSFNVGDTEALISSSFFLLSVCDLRHSSGLRCRR